MGPGLHVCPGLHEGLRLLMVWAALGVAAVVVWWRLVAVGVDRGWEVAGSWAGVLAGAL